MKMNFAIAALVLGSVAVSAPEPATAAPDHRGHGISASHADYRDRGDHRGARGNRHGHGEYRRYGDHRRRGDHRDRRHRRADRHDHAPFSHRGYRKHGPRHRGHRWYGPRRHYGRHRHYSGHRYYAPGRHYHRYRPVVHLYADYDAYFHCPTHGGYFALDDLYYY